MSEIKDEIRNGRIMSKEVVEAAAQKLADKRNEKLTKEMMRLAVDAEYNKKTALLNLQENRDKEDPIKACLKVKEANELSVKEGKMTPEEFRKKNDEAEDDLRKKIRDIEGEYRTLRDQLYKQCYSVLNDWND